MGFPGPAVDRISWHLLAGSDRQTALLSLLALAGTDRATRAAVSRLPPLGLAFDSLASVNRKTLGRRPLERELAFARASPAAKHVCFLAAARLFRGFSDAAFVGPIITDAIVIEVARGLQLDLRSVRVQVGPTCPRDPQALLAAGLRSSRAGANNAAKPLAGRADCSPLAGLPGGVRQRRQHPAAAVHAPGGAPPEQPARAAGPVCAHRAAAVPPAGYHAGVLPPSPATPGAGMSTCSGHRQPPWLKARPLLQLAHLPMMVWTALPSALYLLEPAKRLQNLRLADVGLTSGYSHLLFTKLPNLRWLSMDGEGETVRAAVQHWCARLCLHPVHYPAARGRPAPAAHTQERPGCLSLPVCTWAAEALRATLWAVWRGSC